jgi:hypothetical protein
MLTKTEQFLLLELLLKEKLSFSNQDIFLNRKNFYFSMSKLKKANLVESKVNGNNVGKTYNLHFPDGWAFVNLLLGLEDIPDKYKKIKRDFMVIP